MRMVVGGAKSIKREHKSIDRPNYFLRGKKRGIFDETHWEKEEEKKHTEGHFPLTVTWLQQVERKKGTT